MGRKTQAVALGKAIVRTEPLLPCCQEGQEGKRGCHRTEEGRPISRKSQGGRAFPAQGLPGSWLKAAPHMGV